MTRTPLSRSKGQRSTCREREHIVAASRIACFWQRFAFQSPRRHATSRPDRRMCVRACCVCRDRPHAALVCCGSGAVRQTASSAPISGSKQQQQQQQQLAARQRRRQSRRVSLPVWRTYGWHRVSTCTERHSAAQASASAAARPPTSREYRTCHAVVSAVSGILR